LRQRHNEVGGVTIEVLMSSCGPQSNLSLRPLH